MKTNILISIFISFILINAAIAKQPEATPASNTDSKTAEQSEQTCEALFVHNAKSSVMNGNTLIMKGFYPAVSFFCDRPQRMAGSLTVQEFLDSVSEGPDSFKDNPPNAVLSVISGGQIVDVVLELTNKPQIIGDAMIYPNVRIIEGEPVASGLMSSLFIDMVGRPMSPVSVAGRHRRHRRRFIMRH